MEDLTIKSCKKNVRTYLTKMQDMQNKIDSLQKEGINYNEQRFLTLAFDDLVKTSGDLLADVKHQLSEWVKKPSDFNTSIFITDMINLYTNYKSTGDWDKQVDYHNKVMIALTTDLK